MWQSLLGTLKSRPSCHSVSELMSWFIILCCWLSAAYFPLSLETQCSRAQVMCSSSVRNPQSSKKSSFSSALARLDCKVGSLGEHYFSHFFTARDSHTEDFAMAHSDFSDKDWLFALSLLIVTFPDFAFWIPSLPVFKPSDIVGMNYKECLASSGLSSCWCRRRQLTGQEQNAWHLSEIPISLASGRNAPCSSFSCLSWALWLLCSNYSFAYSVLPGYCRNYCISWVLMRMIRWEWNVMGH